MIKELNWTIIRTQLFDVWIKFFDKQVNPGQEVAVKGLPKRLNGRRALFVPKDTEIVIVDPHSDCCSNSLLTQCKNYIVTIQVNTVLFNYKR